MPSCCESQVIILGLSGFLTCSWRKNCVDFFLVLRFVKVALKFPLRKQTVYLIQHINTHYTFLNGSVLMVGSGPASRQLVCKVSDTQESVETQPGDT